MELNLFIRLIRDSLQTKEIWSYNLVGSLGKFEQNQPTILIGAHLDHIGVKNKNEEDPIFNGANDNASGSTAVLQIAKFLATQKSGIKTYLWPYLQTKKKDLEGPPI